MQTSKPPSFEEWIEWCRRDRTSQGDEDDIDPNGAGAELLCSYLTRLFASPTSFLASADSAEASCVVRNVLWGMNRWSLYGMLRTNAPMPVQVACVKGIARFYVEYLDGICNDCGRRPDDDLTHLGGVDQDVYMIPDSSGGVDSLISDSVAQPLRQAMWDAFEVVLQRCRTSSCQISALHAIGERLPQISNTREAVQLNQLLDEYLRRDAIPSWLRTYAQSIRDGDYVA